MSPDDVCRYARKGQLKGFKEGRQWRFRIRQVNKFKKQLLLLQRSDNTGTDSDPKLSTGYSR